MNLGVLAGQLMDDMMRLRTKCSAVAPNRLQVVDAALGFAIPAYELAISGDESIGTRWRIACLIKQASELIETLVLPVQ